MTKLCSVDGCGLPMKANSYCWGHDKQAKRGGPFHPVTPRKHRRGSQVPWLHAHVAFEGDECLTWPFAFHKDGRGQVTLNKHTLQAHRIMCELAHGPAPTAKHEAAHACGKGHLGCVNPKHLAWKTHTENLADQLIHGTRSRGEDRPNAKLTDNGIRAIREFSFTCSKQTLADLFGVHYETIGKILRGETWGHVQPWA